MEYKLQMTRTKFERADNMVKRAKGYCSDVEWSEDATRSEPAFLAKVIEGVSRRARRRSICRHSRLYDAARIL
jgi:isopropylmalate/homocitrate/citramalate synthase